MFPLLACPFFSCSIATVRLTLLSYQRVREIFNTDSQQVAGADDTFRWRSCGCSTANLFTIVRSSFDLMDGFDFVRRLLWELCDDVADGDVMAASAS